MITVLGLPVVLANLGRIGARIETEMEPEGLAAGAEEIRRAWVANIEAEGLVLTGRYRDSITVEVDGDKAMVKSDVPYAPIL